MAERVRITVHPSLSHPDILTVPDAMRQVLDIFELLSAGEGRRIVWALVSASTNTPLTVEGEAKSLDSNVDIVAVGSAQKAAFYRNISIIREGGIPNEWIFDPEYFRTVKRIMVRSTNGIGETNIVLSDESSPIAITPDFAIASLQTLQETVPVYELLDEDRARDERGAIEGRLLLVGHDYNQPAIKIEERKSRQEVWCRISDEERQRITQDASFDDVWDHRRVIVRGIIRYNVNGNIIRVYANSIERVVPRHIPVERLRDPDFTGGLTIREYLDRFREGDFGI